MNIEEQLVLPAARSLKDFETLMTMKFQNVIVLDLHIAQLVYIRRMAREHGKRLFIHADLVQGLRHDEAATEFLCQVIKPAGLISTHANVIAVAKKNGIVSIQRVFLLDSHALKTSLRVLKATDPDYVEVLPGMMPQVVEDVVKQTKRPVIAGGFIRRVDDVELILQYGASAISTSSKEIWHKFGSK